MGARETVYVQDSIAASERGLLEEALPQGTARTPQLWHVAPTQCWCALDWSWDPCVSPAIGIGLWAHAAGMQPWLSPPTPRKTHSGLQTGGDVSRRGRRAPQAGAGISQALVMPRSKEPSWCPMAGPGHAWPACASRVALPARWHRARCRCRWMSPLCCVCPRQPQACPHGCPHHGAPCSGHRAGCMHTSVHMHVHTCRRMHTHAEPPQLRFPQDFLTPGREEGPSTANLSAGMVSADGPPPRQPHRP